MKIWNRMKGVLRNTPIIGTAWARFWEHRARFRSTSEYCDGRYKDGSNSGSGNYNLLAEFEANFLSRFMDYHQVISIVEFLTTLRNFGPRTNSRFLILHL